MKKKILKDKEAMDKLVLGVSKLADIVGMTLGPKGRNALIERQNGSPLITNDGVSIAKEIEFEDQFENLGARLVKDVSSRANKMAGDGTTTATVLANAIISEAQRYEKTNFILAKKGIDAAGAEAVRLLGKMTKIIDTLEDTEHIACISAGSDIGKIVAEAIWEVGKHGSVTVADSYTSATTIEITSGMRVDTGYISPYMATDMDKKISSLNDCLVYVTNTRILKDDDIIPVLQLAYAESKSLLVVCDDMEGEALKSFMMNKVKNGMSITAIKGPGLGDRRDALLEDICILTGAVLVQKDKIIAPEDCVGHAENIRVEKYTTIISNGSGKQHDIDQRVSELIAKKEGASNYATEKLSERISKFTGGVGVIRVGANSAIELEDKKLRIEDAINATRAALEEGIVIGGGSALLKVQQQMQDFHSSDSNTEAGIRIVTSALSAPFVKILSNSGEENIDEIIKEVLREPNLGYDGLNNKVVEMFECGIIDPVKVTRSALESAVSASGTILTTGAIVGIVDGLRDI